MNRTELLTYKWLQTHKGYKPEEITFQTAKSPDFLTDDGRCWETKLARNGVVLFWTTQVDALADHICSVVVFDVNDLALRGDDALPALVMPYEDLEVPGRHGKFQFKVVDALRGKKIVGLSLDSALKAELEAEARRQHRSLNNLIELVLSEWAARLIQYEATGDLK